MKKIVWESARTGVLTSMILVGSALGGRTALAQVSPEYSASIAPKNASGMHIGHRFNSPTKINALAVQLGLDPQQVKQEVLAGKSVKEILMDNGITMDQIDQ